MLSKFRELIQERRNRDILYSTMSYWDHKATIYNEHAVSMWPNNSLNILYERESYILINERLLNVSFVSGKKLLDIGCGTGRFSYWFAQKGAQVTGIDFSAGALAIAERQSVHNNPVFRHISIFDLDEKNVYDVAFVWAVLTMACRDKDQLLDALTKIRSALKSSGVLLLMEPIHQGFLHRVLNLDLSSFLDVVRDAGFEVKTITPMHFWPIRLLLAYIPWPKSVTVPIYYFGQFMMKIPCFSKLGDYWGILASPV